ncbi:MAG: hypothetical protein Q9165_008887 [Trypethelium subeluteriae]
MEPLSITTGILSLATVCIKVTMELKKFRDGIVAADPTISGLLTEVERYRDVMKSMKETCDKAETINLLQTTGHIRNHWQNISKSLQDGQGVLNDLLGLLQDVNKSVSMKETRDQIPDLNVLSREIRRMGLKITKELETLAAIQENIPEARIQAEGAVLINLQECIRSSNTIVSEASTILGRSSEGESISGSNLALALAPRPSELTLRWMASTPAFAVDVFTPSQPPESIIASVQSEILGNESLVEPESDPDADLEADIAKAYIKRVRKRLLGSY